MDERNWFVPSSPFLTGVVVVLVAAYGYFTFRPPLDSSRPESPAKQGLPAPPAPPTTHSIHARLWEDPLAIAYADEQNLPNQNPAAVAGKRPLVRKLMERIADKFSRKAPLLVIPVLVPGGIGAEEREQRIRTRYAVLSALAESGFQLNYPAQMTYADIPINIEIATDKQSQLIRVPLKLYTRRYVEHLYDDVAPPSATDPVTTAVFALWVNENQLGDRPLQTLSQIVEYMFDQIGEQGRMQLRMIGPSQSELLVRMAMENDKIEEGHHHFTYDSSLLLSPRATLFANLLRNEYEASLSQFTSGSKTKSGLRVLRTIGNDMHLVYALRDELRLRGAWPDDHAENERIALITESDTVYGHALPTDFEKALEETVDPNAAGAQPDKTTSNRVEVFTYLRGIDGQSPSVTQRQAGAKAKNDGTGDNARPTISEDELASPTGSSQFDYLQRLEQFLRMRHRELKERGGRGITAIGVVGSDVYDKLLILRALRPAFGQFVFFTTDLDSEFATAGEYRTTRNLIVASHFGLRLNHCIQRQTPTFRDSYQTSVFLATLLALENPNVKKHKAVAGAWKSLVDDDDKTVQPLWPEIRADLPDPYDLVERDRRLWPTVFEIARSGPYQLTHTHIADDTCKTVPDIHVAEVRWANSWIADNWLRLAGVAVLFCVAVVLSFQEHTTRAFWRRTAVWFALFFVAAGLLAVLIYRDQQVGNDGRFVGEPFEVFQGISVWPGIIIRWTVAIASCALLFVGYRDLMKNYKDLWGRFVRQEVSDDDLSEIIARERSGAHPIRDSLRRWVRPWLPRDDGPDTSGTVNDLLGESMRRHHWSYSILIVSFVALLWFGFVVWLVYPFETQPAIRGAVSFFAWWSALLIGGYLMTFLIVFVLDATGQCRRLANSLWKHSGPVPDWEWTEQSENELRDVWTAVDFQDRAELLRTRLIANRTRVVGKLMTYPFMIVTIWILARHPSFEEQYSPPYVALMAAIFLLLIIYAAMLRRDVRRGRDNALERLRESLAAATAHDPRGAANAPDTDRKWDRRIDQLEQLIEEVKNESRGAFRPLTQDVLFRAIAIPFGGVGTLLLAEQIMQ